MNVPQAKFLTLELKVVGAILAYATLPLALWGATAHQGKYATWKVPQRLAELQGARERAGSTEHVLQGTPSTTCARPIFCRPSRPSDLFLLHYHLANPGQPPSVIAQPELQSLFFLLVVCSNYSFRYLLPITLLGFTYFPSFAFLFVRTPNWQLASAGIQCAPA
jgi:hypothetical protein